MIRQYDSAILKNPRTVLLGLLAVFIFFGYWIKDFRLDASSDSLVLENDDDVRYFQMVSDRYNSNDFVFMTYTPPEELFSKISLDRLKSLRDELKALDGVTSVVTILDAPLIKNPPGPLKELSDNIKTLESPKANLLMAVNEFRTSPIYQDLLVSQDLKSTAIQINLRGEKNREIYNRRSELRRKKFEKRLTREEGKEMKQVETDIRRLKDRLRSDRHGVIASIREILNRYRGSAEMFLGGVPMVADDITTFIKNDLKIFGAGMAALLVGTLFLIFKRAQWVALSLSCCVASVFVMMGILGMMQWDVTVVSSNFISLQLILTLALAIHLVGRYTELLGLKPDASNQELVREAVGDVFIPALHCQLTTIVGFASLVTCNILPVVNFGWMMSAGLIVSQIITFLLLPVGILLLPKLSATGVEAEFGRPVTSSCARFVQGHRKLILAVTGIFAVATVIGCMRLEVENSFINYFKQSTEIYRGMKFIDDHMGGTTPLDIMIDFKTDEPANGQPATEKADDEFSEFEDDKESASKYWYTPAKLELVEKVHDYTDALPATGKVLSLATLWKTTRDLNEGKEFDNITTALIFEKIPEKFKEILVKPYVSIENNQARLTTRIKDSIKELRRDPLLKQIRKELVEKVGLKEDQFRLTGLMVLYNNMLQSLYNSQIKTFAWTLLPLALMFYAYFRSVKVTLVAMVPSVISTTSVLGFMGLTGIPLDMMTITVVAVGLGIAVDNSMHYLHRFKHEIAVDGDYVQAMRRCHESIGNNMYYASLPTILGFSILAFSNFVPSILFGILVAVAMLIALISDLNLLPTIIITFKPFGPEREKNEQKV